MRPYFCRSAAAAHRHRGPESTDAGRKPREYGRCHSPDRGIGYPHPWPIYLPSAVHGKCRRPVAAAADRGYPPSEVGAPAAPLQKASAPLRPPGRMSRTSNPARISSDSTDENQTHPHSAVLPPARSSHTLRSAPPAEAEPSPDDDLSSDPCSVFRTVTAPCMYDPSRSTFQTATLHPRSPCRRGSSRPADHSAPAAPRWPKPAGYPAHRTHSTAARFARAASPFPQPPYIPALLRTDAPSSR